MLSASRRSTALVKRDGIVTADALKKLWRQGKGKNEAAFLYIDLNGKPVGKKSP